MAAPLSLLPELDEIVKHGSAERRSSAIERLAELFLRGADNFGPQHIEVFDGVLTGLVPAAEIEVRANLAERMADLTNAPPGLINYLAREEQIRVAGPVLSRSPILDEESLLEIAQSKSQDHLAAISGRALLTIPVTDIILQKGDRSAIRILARNDGAVLSDGGYNGLIGRAADDGVLALSLGQREDITPAQLKDLLSKSVDLVRQRMLDSAKPAQRLAINRVMTEISSVPRMPPAKRDFTAAQQIVRELYGKGQLNEAALLGFAKEHKYEETVATLAAMSGVRLATLDQLVLGERSDPVLLIAKAIGLGWTTVRALISLRLGPGRSLSPPDIEEARVNFERLANTTAQRVLAFWSTRDTRAPA
jgi:uncharacterized protein (DUF2336 family)